MKIEVDCALARVVEATSAEREFLSNYLTFADPQARFSNGNPIFELLNRIDDTFPSGFAGKVRKAGATRTHLSGRLDPVEVELVDVRKPPPERAHPDLAWLRDYQKKAVEAALTRTRGIVQISTGGGKTEVMAAIVASVPGPWLILVPQADLLEQTADRLEKRTGERPGIVGDGQWNPGRVTVATFQTLSRRMSKAKDRAAYQLVEQARGLIVDECFPAGTLVGGRPIETLREGDFVPSYDEATKQLVQRRVVRTFCKKPASLVSVRLADGRSITCTEEHPFLVESGEWVPAKSTAGHRVLRYAQEVTHDDQDSDSSLHAMRDTDSAAEHLCAERSVLHAMPHSAQRGAAEAHGPAVPSLRCACNAVGRSGAGKGTERAQLLQPGAQTRVGVCSQFCLGISAQQEECSQIIGQNEGSQSDAAPRSAADGFGKVESEKAQACNARREWPGASCAASDAMGGTGRGMASRVCDTHQQDKQSSQCHKVGHCVALHESGDRGGRRISLLTQGQGEGCAKDRVSQLIRVDSVEIHQQTSDGRFDGLCADGNVYNIEVEGTHTYLVDGVVVHNCHTVASGTLGFVCSKAVRAYYRIGFSATPLDRSDKKSIFVIAQLGGIIHKTSSAELRALGMLADANIKMVRVEQGSNAPTWPGVYGECVVRSKPRNAVVAEMARQASKPALVFVSQVGQGRTLLPMIQKLGMRAALVWGEDNTDARRAALADLVSGKLDVIVCSSVFQQAIDVPTLAAVVNGAGGSSIIQTLQRIGRGTRIAAGKTSFDVWDVLDAGHRWLSKHGEKRMQTYKDEGYKVEVIDTLGAGGPVLDPRKDEHGFTLGSAAQAAHRASVRKEALQQLVGMDKLSNPRRGRVLRPHEVVGYGCTVCGAPSDALPPECMGYRPEESQPSLIKA